MDTSLLNLEEHFSTYHDYGESDDRSSLGDNRGYFNEWEDERELNGDIGLIPESSSFCESLKDMTDLTDSPTSVLFQKMIDWSTFIYADGVDNFSPEAISNPIPELPDYKERPSLDGKDLANFDLATYLNEPTDSSRKVKSAGKKIDKEAQRYIIDDKSDKLDTSDEIDVETVSEGTSLPVLEANDAFSLLEQFEASEKPILSKTGTNLTDSFGFTCSLADNLDLEVDQIPSSPIEIFEKVPRAPIDIFEDVKVAPKPEDDAKPKPSEAQTYVKNKQILDALPQELIARINESGKRKTITVIPPIPNKKRGNSRPVDTVSQHRSKVAKTSSTERVQLDHDYCAAASPYPKEPRKDSGFQSEEDDRSVIRNQPTVKTADGKLMVSLLKVNTIRCTNQKRKLNLEEYKRRRLIGSNTTSLSSSPISSTCSSPLPEDENAKRLKHQEKLMKMAAELLKTPAKSARPETAPPPPVESAPPPRPVTDRIAPPPDLEVKTFVSIATNTDISSINCSKSILASSRQLEQIKPLLRKVSDKINSSSFITSLMENIPKAKTKMGAYVKSEDQEVVREDKIIHYLKKDRVPAKTTSVGCQTDFEADDEESRYRRRMDGRRSPSSSSSTGSSRSRRSRRRASSNSSRHSRSSRSSDSSASSTASSSRSSRSRSRSFSPKRARQYSAERLREVEERRVIYVGRIAVGTTKEDLRRRFIHFGPITTISLHFRDHGDNYGFVTFVNKEDAYEAVEHGNDHAYPIYDLSFGGRRIFCKTTYSDLDNMREDDYNYYSSRAPDCSFDALLRAAQEKIRKRKS